jgi:hypothetical protein
MQKIICYSKSFSVGYGHVVLFFSVFFVNVFCQSELRKASTGVSPGKCELLSNNDGIHPLAEGGKEMARLVQIALKMPGAWNRREYAQGDVTIQIPYSLSKLNVMKSGPRLTPSRCPLWELAHYGKYRSCTTST